MKRKVLLVLLMVLVVLSAACEPSGVTQKDAVEGRKVELTPVWTFHAGLALYNVYEFTDVERGEHCYVITKWGDYRSGVALSCERIGK